MSARTTNVLNSLRDISMEGRESVVLTRESGVPLYQQIKVWIADNIYRGVWKPGDVLPSEVELERQFGVSRTTVRQAIADLQAEGVVQKQQGRGTFVSHPKYEEKLPALRGFTEDIIAKGHVPRSIVLSSEIIRPQPRIIDKLRLTPKDDVFKLVRLRLIDEEPVQIHTVYLPMWVADLINYSDIDFSTRSLYSEMERAGIRLDEAEEVLEASVASELHSSLLRVPKGAPLIITERQTFDVNGRVVEFSIVEIRGDKYRHSVKLKRGQ